VLTRDQAIAKMKKPISKRVSFTYPGSEGTQKGVLKDRAVVWSGDHAQNVQYYDVADLIEFDGKSDLWMRLGYYRQVGEDLRWASQTTITEPLDVWRRFFVATAREKDWFRTLLSEVAKELEHPE
jgi:hypothetical protein